MLSNNGHVCFSCFPHNSLQSCLSTLSISANLKTPTTLSVPLFVEIRPMLNDLCASLCQLLVIPFAVCEIDCCFK